MTSRAPLDGITVVSLEQAVAAPYASAELAAGGARVIKIERAEGDFARRYDAAAKGEASYFVWLNQGKQSIALDIKDATDAALLARMIARADVFIQNLAPWAADRAGFGSHTLRARHPALITCDISGYGGSPDLTGKKAYDLLVQAESGLSAITGSADAMGRIGVSICDIGAGMTAHAAILEALIARGCTGQGQAIEVSLFDVAANWMTVPYLHSEHGDGPPERQGLQHPSIAPYGAYVTSDGSATLIAVQNEREWDRLTTEVLRAPDLATDAAFSSNTDRVRNRVTLDTRLNAVISALDAVAFRGRLDQARIAWGAVSSVPELARHRALRTRVLRGSSGQSMTAPARAAGVGHAQGPAPEIDAQGQALRDEFAR